MRTSLPSLLLALGLAACSETPRPAPVGSGSAPAHKPSAGTTTSAPAPSSSAPQAPALEPGGSSAPAVTAANALGFDLFAKLRARPGNLAFSPASIAAALAMTYGGAQGDTATEMKRVLHAPDDAEAFHGGWASLFSEWKGIGGEGAPVIEVANRLFGEKSLAFEADFVALSGKRYGAPLDPSDFRGAAEAERGRINGWVAEKTHDRIRDLLPPRAIDGDTRIVLANALYFKATWAEPFAADRTAPGPFTTADGKRADVPMMHLTETVRYGESGDVQLLELGYRGGRFATLFALPKDEKGLGALEEKLTADALAGWVGALAPLSVKVTLPRFELRPGEPIDLVEPLKALGMKRAFESTSADFTGIAKGEPIFLTGAYHKAFVAMDEAGTEAAAATAIVGAKGAGSPDDPKEFVADHPFLFFIRDTASGLVLFVGRVADPAG